RPAIAMVLFAVACEGGPEPILNPVRESYEKWIKIDTNAVCGNNTPYKIFVNYSDKSDNLVVMFEPGGACWDYDSCTGRNGIRGAANPNGIPDDHYKLAPFISPFVNRSADNVPTADWNFVYVPYCTGDVHTGNTVATYSDETGTNTVEFHHDGHNAS